MSAIFIIPSIIRPMFWKKVFFALLQQDGIVTVEEFKKAVQQSCVGRSYRDFPQAMKMFIDSHFKLVDINGEPRSIYVKSTFAIL